MNNAFKIILFLVANACFLEKVAFGYEAPLKYRVKQSEVHRRPWELSRDDYYYNSEPRHQYDFRDTGYSFPVEKVPISRALPTDDPFNSRELNKDVLQNVMRSIQNITTRLGALENCYKDLGSLIEKNGQHFDEAKETLQAFLLKFSEVSQITTTSATPNSGSDDLDDDDCVTKCIRDDSCTSVVWTNSSSSICKINSNKTTFINFTQGENFYCKDCETTFPLVLDGEDSGVIKIVNVALNKTTQASSYAFGNGPAMAVDGKINTQFSSESLATKDEPWLMVDLGERHLVAQIRIQVANTPLKKRRGGSFKVCLVDAFDPKMNPCNTDTEILVVANRLRSSSIVFDISRVRMGRYVFLQKINRKDIFEIAELDVLAVFPVVPYLCVRCNKNEKTICDTSTRTPTCQCSDSKLFPINGEAINGCTNPCKRFSEENSVCVPLDFERKSCSCKKGNFYPIDNDACKGCKDPCHRFSAKNTECIPVNVNSFYCKCDDNYSPIVLGNPCQGCKLKDPCEGFVKENSVCTAVDPGKKNCSCDEGSFYPVDEDPCIGCKDPCSGFRAKNSVCVPIDFKNYDCECEENYSPAILDDPCLGCKLNDNCADFSKENAICIEGDCSCKEGPFYPVGGDPCNGCKDPCSGFKAKNSKCIPIDFKNYDCECEENYSPAILSDSCLGCKINDPCGGFKVKNSICIPIDFKKFNCECEENYSPAILNDPCFGCKLNDPCDGFCKENSVCTRGDSGEKKNCSCNEGSFPVGGDPCNGCKDPCRDFRAKNSVCFAIDFKNYDCECAENYSPAILNDPCLGCKLNDPCDSFCKENSVCIRADPGEKKNCSCKKGSFYPVDGDPCNGCKDPCSGFRAKNSVCIPIDFKNYDCECEENYSPVILDDPCLGCKLNDKCTEFSKENAICIKGDCSCKEGPFYPIGGDPCNGCKDPCRGFDSNNTICVPIDSENHNCQCTENYAPIDVNDICLGCVKEKVCTNTGEISSPNYPNKYPNDYSKTWKLETSSNCQINLKFLAFSLEDYLDGPKCKYDSLIIREGPSSTSPILKTICGNETQPEICSTNHAFYLEFKTSFFNQYSGFHIIWKEVPNEVPGK